MCAEDVDVGAAPDRGVDAHDAEQHRRAEHDRREEGRRRRIPLPPHRRAETRAKM